MSKKLILLTIFLAATIFISGCITDKEKQNNRTISDVNSDIIPTINLPSGFTFMAIHETSEDIGKISRKAKEGFYRTEEGEDVYVRVFETETPGDLLNEYKSQYKDDGYDPFTEVYFNGHNATKMMFYSTKDGRSVSKYNIIWTKNNSMIKVGPSVDAQKVIDLATATNN